MISVLLPVEYMGYTLNSAFQWAGKNNEEEGPPLVFISSLYHLVVGAERHWCGDCVLLPPNSHFGTWNCLGLAPAVTLFSDFIWYLFLRGFHQVRLIKNGKGK